MGDVGVVVADDNVEFCELLVEAIGQSPRLSLLACCNDGESALRAVEQHQPDVLVLDIVMPKIDGIGVLERLQSGFSPETRPKVLVLSAFGEESLMRSAQRLGAAYYLMKPFDLETLLRRIHQFVNPDVPPLQRRAEQRREQIEREVIGEMLRLGVPAHYKGYQHLREAITLVVEDSALLSQVTKGLYPAVADRCQTSPPKVERTIRHAIEATWTRGNIDIINQRFAYTVDGQKGKPTNSSFIARIADQVRMKLKGNGALH